jgi:hypothetical protein
VEQKWNGIEDKGEPTEKKTTKKTNYWFLGNIDNK